MGVKGFDSGQLGLAVLSAEDVDQAIQLHHPEVLTWLKLKKKKKIKTHIHL